MVQNCIRFHPHVQNPANVMSTNHHNAMWYRTEININAVMRLISPLPCAIKDQLQYLLEHRGFAAGRSSPFSAPAPSRPETQLSHGKEKQRNAEKHACFRRFRTVYIQG